VVQGYLVGALRHERSSGSRGGGSRSCKHDLGCVIESKKLRASCSLRALRLVRPAITRALEYGMP